MEFTCELKPSAELYAGIRKEAVDAKSGVQVLQAMADAFRAALGNGASQQLDMSKNIDTMIAATGVTKNELTVRFAINSDDKKKFDLSSVSTKFFWGKDSANLANPKDSLHAVYDNVPFVANTAGKEKTFREDLFNLYNTRTVAAGSAPASAPASSPAK